LTGLKDTLFCNGYPIELLVTIIDKRLEKAENNTSTPKTPTDIVPLVEDKKISTVLPYIPKWSDKLRGSLKNITLLSPLKTQIQYRAFSTAAKTKPAPFWVVVFIEFPVLVAVFMLVEPNRN
jgi:hypothetical protein